MNKKLMGCIAIGIAVVLGVGGMSVFKYNEKIKKENQMIAMELETIKDIEVIEGENLPPVEEVFKDTTMIDGSSITADIQNVDVTIPGLYEITYSFQDLKGGQRSKTVSCIVKADLEKHVEGMEDLTVDYKESLPEPQMEHDEYVDSVVRDDSKVDVSQPGTYPITYTILGLDGEMLDIEKKCIVYDTRPDPTPTPKPVKEKEPEDVKTGNVENTVTKDHTVETGDHINIMYPLLGLFFSCAIGMFVYHKKLHI